MAVRRSRGSASRGVVAETTGRTLDSELPVLSTTPAPGPGEAVRACEAPQLIPREESPERPESTAEIEERRRQLSLMPRYRYRARFTKMGRITWIGHLDLTRMLLRALRRARVPLVYSQGFNPKPRVGFSPALAVGLVSEAEYIDFESWDRLPPESAVERINAALPRDVRFLALREIPRDAPSLGELIRAARYRAISSNGLDVAGALSAFQPAGAIIERTRKNGKKKLFELEHELLQLEQVDDSAVRLTLAMHSDGPSVRPDEVLGVIFGAESCGLRLVREELLAGVTDKLVNPMLAGSVSHPELSD